VNFGLTDEQTLLREAAADALSRIDSVAAARAALDGGPLPDLWPTACAAGWPGLLVAEEHGGAGLGAFDAMLVLEECGRRLTGAGLIGHLGATLVLDRADADGPLAPLAAGERRAAFVFAAPGARTLPRLEAGRVTGAARFVPDLAGADDVVVPALDVDGELRAVLLAGDAPGVAVEPVLRGDPTRPLGHLTLDGAAGEILPGDGIDEGWYLAQSLLAADALGVSQAVLDLAVAYAKERHAFGRPIGSYQAIKHQIVEILRHVETTRNLCYYAGFAAEQRPDDLALAASAARFAGEEAAEYATRTCIAVHGGIGATWEHDAPLYWRRAQLSRLLLGGVAGAADRVAEEILTRAREHAAVAA
jgi:alkylation response protein AidB-like acyl-CoA dehydrogenase